MDLEGAVSQAVGRMTVGSCTQPEFVVADSKFELEIKDLKEFQKGKHTTTDRILLMDMSDAAW